MELSASDKKNLLKLARAVIQNEFKPDSECRRPAEFLPEFPVSNNRPAAVFVTLTRSGDLRGCIGSVVPEQPLAEAVLSMSVLSAFEDPRFPPVTENELKKLSIEISVLSPMKKVPDASAIIPNEHGVAIRKGFRTGLFLPQVWEHFSSKEAFLNELSSSKAGLPKDAWKDPDTEILIFTVEHFSDDLAS